ncbi:MAG: hypothetical protein KKC51_15250 [Verrucomicrobia bacterium]|nr:hypothetical protein [Verrucomicrobiota bacterium]
MNKKVINKVIFIFLIVTGSSLAVFLDESPEVWCKPTNDLQIALITVQSAWVEGDDIEFYVAFRNAGEKDMFINLGVTLANGRNHFPTEVSLLLIDQDGQSRKLHLLGPATISGRMDDYAVGLGARSMHLLKLHLSEFCSPPTNEFRIKLSNGHYKATAQFNGHGALNKNTGMDWTAWNFWEGFLESPAVEFIVQKKK